MGKVRTPLDPVADLKRRLARSVTEPGPRLRKVRKILHAWWRDHGFAEHPATVGKRIALALIAQRKTEDKFAGILLLQEILGDQLRVTDLPAFAELFDAGHLAEWNVVDWFCERVLVTMLAREAGRAEVAHQIAAWRDADTTWQRRAACISFVELAPEGDPALPGLVTLVLSTCATVVWSHERPNQAAVGWVLRELSRADAPRVEAFFRRNARLMSKECARYAVAKYPAAQRTALLAHHKRATKLRR